MSFLLVGAGGFLGAISRYAVSLVLGTGKTEFPVGTFLVNLLGCLFLGLLLKSSTHGVLSQHWLLFLGIGFLGSFTTFSAFGVETFYMIQAGKLSLALTYALSSVLIGVAFGALGWSIIK